MRFPIFFVICLGLVAPTPPFAHAASDAGPPIAPLVGDCVATCAKDALAADQCNQRCGFPALPTSGLGAKVDSNSSSSTSSLNQIVSTGTTTYYGGVVQISAGITQLSQSAQNRSTSGANNENRTELVRGLQNIQAGTEAVQKAQGVIDYANSLSSSQSRNASVGEVGTSSKFSLDFDPNKAGKVGQSVLAQMESVAGVSTEKLKEAVKDPEYVYDLAAGAKGMSLSGEELKDVVEAAVAKAGKPTNPELTGGATMADLMKDLDMFMNKKGAAEPAKIEAGEVKAAKVEPTQAPPLPENAQVPVEKKQTEKTAIVESGARELAGLADEALPNVSAELAASGSELELSLFQRVHRRYDKWFRGSQGTGSAR